MSSTIASTTEPIRNTAAYKTLAETLVDALDDSGSAKHAGFEEKEARRKRRQARLAKAGRDSITGQGTRVKANPEYVFGLFPHLSIVFLRGFTDMRVILLFVMCRAGSAMVLHKDSPRQEAWNKLKETNPLLRSLSSFKQAFDESENPVVSSIRSATHSVARWFDETESAQVQRLMKAMDPSFNMESFERELREYIVPEVVDAYLTADQEALKAWCGEAVSTGIANICEG